MKSTEASFYVGSICWLLTCRLDGVNQQLQRSRPLMAQRDLAPKEGAMLLALLLLPRSEGERDALWVAFCVVAKEAQPKRNQVLGGDLLEHTNLVRCCKRVRFHVDCRSASAP